MSIANKISDACTNIGLTLKSIAKVTLLSRGVRFPMADINKPLIILANGPSLNHTIEHHLDLLQRSNCLAVNFAANAPQFKQLQPRYYVLIDPFFFSASDADNLKNLRNNLAAVDWDMTIFVPRKYRSSLPSDITANKHISVCPVNPVGYEGLDCIGHSLFDKGLAMPRPRNVLIPSIMIGLSIGYRNIYICGADHSWTRTLSVDDCNRVVSIQPHFYKDGDDEVKRVNTEYMNYPLHQIIQSFYVAFKAYHDIRRYADSRGVKIYNATPDSFIDAFERRGLENL